MGRFTTFPIIYDEVKQIHISVLKSYGYLQAQKAGVFTWKKNDQEVSSISLKTIFIEGECYLKLSYKCNGKSIKHEIPIVHVKSNLGKGVVSYFLCPYANKRCRVLYFIDGHFLHREAFEGGYYEKQTQSKSWRQMDKMYGTDFLLDECYEKLHAKHFKKQYAGKPTKKYLNLLKKIEKLENTMIR